MRLALEAVIAFVACGAMVYSGPASMTGLAVPLINGYVYDLGLFFIVFGAFVIIGAGNAVNLTDGLDGLAIVPVMIAAGSFGVIAWVVGNAIFSTHLGVNLVPGTGELAVVCGAIIGAGGGWMAGRAEGGAMVREYLLANPEVIPEAMERLQRREQARAVATAGGGITKPYAGAFLGNPNGDVVLVDACLGGSQNDALSALRNGDIMGVGAVIIDGVPRFVGRSRNTPETTRRAKVAHSRVPQMFSGEG